MNFNAFQRNSINSLQFEVIQCNPMSLQNQKKHPNLLISHRQTSDFMSSRVEVSILKVQTHVDYERASDFFTHPHITLTTLVTKWNALSYSSALAAARLHSVTLSETSGHVLSVRFYHFTARQLFRAVRDWQSHRLMSLAELTPGQRLCIFRKHARCFRIHTFSCCLPHPASFFALLVRLFPQTISSCTLLGSDSFEAFVFVAVRLANFDVLSLTVANCEHLPAFQVNGSMQNASSLASVLVD
jgi:hypothetical protein